MIFTLRQYLSTLGDPYSLTRTLGDIDLCRDEQGNLLCSTGNSAAVFRFRRQGRIYALRCYFRPMRHLREIYGQALLEKELYLYTTPHSGAWVDVVVSEWIEGKTLYEATTHAAHADDRGRLAALAGAFDKLAAELLADNRAHGDLKPENTLVDAAGRLHLIDFDAQFLPAFAGEPSPELGTAAYQHPSRTAADFDAHLDDYPAALMATALHALALDPTLYDRYHAADGLLFAPQKIHTDPALREALKLFEHAGLARQYRIAEALLSPSYRLFGLDKLFAAAVTPPQSTCEPLELFASAGRWGYRTAAGTLIDPLYDCGFDFSEGLAAVQLGTTWHFIDTAGRTVVSCPGCEAVKPFRNGRAQLIRGGRRIEIDPSGQEFDF